MAANAVTVIVGNRQLGNLDGVVWFRKIIDVSANDAGKEATLELAMIDDNDVTYVNGVKREKQIHTMHTENIQYPPEF